MAKDWWKLGAADAQQGKGQQNPNAFKEDKPRKDYQAGWWWQKRKGGRPFS